MKSRGYDADKDDLVSSPISKPGAPRDRSPPNETIIDMTPAADPHADAPVRRLVPFSGIQFLDLEIDAGILPMISTWFTEEAVDTAAGQRRVLLPLQSEHTPDGSVFHPVTFRPLGPADTMSYSGLEAVEPFLGSWTPLPYLRYLGRAPAGNARFDQGPSNWARIYIERPAGGLRGCDRLRAVLAFDTRLDPTSRSDTSPYTAPNVEDALFASTFTLVDNPEQVSAFLSQPWIAAWLKDVVASQVGEPADTTRFTLAHLGRYLGLLKVLDKASMLPRIRFIDSVSRSLPLPVIGLDLVIDLGPSETTAVLVPRDLPLSPANASEFAIPLRLRDLAEPVVIHSGPIPTIVEFDNQTFGNAQISRRSGRTDAFSWPSLLRIGAEAQRLALRGNAVDGLTGVADVHAGLANTARSEHLWRYSTTGVARSKAGPMVNGEIMRHVGEDGDVAQRNDLMITAQPGSDASGWATSAPSANHPAVRPRFSQSALSGFFLVELLLHAMGEINSAEPTSPFGAQSASRTELHRIQRIIVTSPLAMAADERQLLVERVHNAIDIVWRAQRFDDGGTLPHPEKPQVALSIGADVGLQLIHLYDEVQRKFGGSFSDFVDCVRRRTGDIDAADRLRIASLEVGMRALGLTIMDYDVGQDGVIEAELVSTDRAAQGAERIVDALAASVVARAIERALGEAGMPDPRQFLIRIGELSEGDATPKSTKAVGIEGNHLARRLETKIIKPAAAQIFKHYAMLPPRAGLGVSRTRLDALAASGGGALDPTAEEFDALARAHGARNFQLSAVLVESSRREFERHLAAELWPGIDAVCEAVRSLDCDLVVIGGDLADLDDLLDRLTANAPVAPGRIACLGGCTADTVRVSTAIGLPAARPTSFDAVLGAYMASRNLLHASGFRLATRKVADHLALDADPARTALPRGTAQPLTLEGTATISPLATSRFERMS